MAKILVAGDVTIDLVKENKEKEKFDADYNEQHIELYYDDDALELSGGAMLLAEMIENLPNPKKDNVLKYNAEQIGKKSKNFTHTIINLDEYKKTIDNDSCPDEKIHRVESFEGFRFSEIPEDDRIIPKIDYQDYCDTSPADFVLIHDAGNYFRKEDKFWPIQIDKIFRRKEINSVFIHKMSYPIAEGKLWEVLQKKNKLVLIILADDLRENGLRISRSLSWERTAYDLINSIKKIRKLKREKINDPDIKRLKDLFELEYLNLVIRFEIDGAILYQNKGQNCEYTLFYDPKIFEDDLEHKYPGNMKSLGVAFNAGLFYGIRKYRQDLDYGIKEGIKTGLIVGRRLYEYGFEKNELDDGKIKFSYPYGRIFQNIDECPKHIQQEDILDDIKWKIISQKLDNINDITEVAFEIVRNGNSEKLTAPVVEFGRLRTPDRSEIESYQSIKNLIKDYVNKRNVFKPISIAVFGPPGSGKTFGVTEIAKNISDDIIKVDFNLSQFSSPDDLISAFHIIQSKAIAGKIPLVFFDEFDSKLENTSFGWLKYFLSPMNDGFFKKGDNIYPIGKCIFVFAGGTKKTFEEFDASINKPKGSDFVSRLRGFINIVGINRDPFYKNKNILNCENENNFNDDNFNDLIIRQQKAINLVTLRNSPDKEDHYMIRRAFVLRTVLENKAPNIFTKVDNKKIAKIDNSVLGALIKVPNYKHGNRSMEAIIEMSTLSHKKRFDRSALPSSQQLKLHVDLDAFKYYLDEIYMENSS